MLYSAGSGIALSFIGIGGKSPLRPHRGAFSRSGVPTAVTELLRRLSAGERAAFDELRWSTTICAGWLSQLGEAERDGHTLNATALVHETYD
jgi:hypothetical protein